MEVPELPDGAFDVTRVREHDVDKGSLKDIGIVENFFADICREVRAGFVHDPVKFVKKRIISDACFDSLLDVRVNGHVRCNHACALGSFSFVGNFAHRILVLEVGNEGPVHMKNYTITVRSGSENTHRSTRLAEHQTRARSPVGSHADKPGAGGRRRHRLQLRTDI